MTSVKLTRSFVFLAGRYLRDYLVSYSLIFLLSLLVFSPALINRFALHDNFMQYSGIQNPEIKQQCIRQGQYKYIHSIGRPVAAYYECKVYQFIHGFSDHQVLRFYIVAIIAGFGALLFLCLRHLTGSMIHAAALTVAMLYTPSFQHAVTMTSVGNTIAFATSLLSAMIFPLQFRWKSPWLVLRLLLSFALLIFTCYAYQVAVFFFFVPVFVRVLWSDDQHPIKTLDLVKLIMFFALCGLLYNRHPLFFAPDYANAADMYQLPQLSKLWEAFARFYHSPFIHAFNFWFLSGDDFVAYYLMLFVVVSSIGLFIFDSRLRRRVILAVLLFQVIIGVCIMAYWSYRILTPIICTLLVALYFIVHYLLQLLPKRPRWEPWRKWLAPAALAFAAVTVSHLNITYNVTGLAMELALYRHTLASYSKPLTHIRVITLHPEDEIVRSIYGIIRNDDTNHMYNSQQQQNINVIVYALIHDLFPGRYWVVDCELDSVEDCKRKNPIHPNNVYITKTYAGDEYCVYPNTLVLNTLSYLDTFGGLQYSLGKYEDRKILSQITQGARNCGTF